MNIVAMYRKILVLYNLDLFLYQQLRIHAKREVQIEMSGSPLGRILIILVPAHVCHPLPFLVGALSVEASGWCTLLSIFLSNYAGGHKTTSSAINGLRDADLLCASKVYTRGKEWKPVYPVQAFLDRKRFFIEAFKHPEISLWRKLS